MCPSCLKIVGSEKRFYILALTFFAFYLFSFSLNLPEHLNVTVFLGASIMSLPVAGFLPLRSRF